MADNMRLTEYLRDNARFLSAGVLLTFFSSVGQTYFIALFAGEIRVEFGLSHGAWGGIYMIGTMASAVVMIWAGALTDTFRVRVLGPLALLGSATACLAMAMNPWVWGLPFVVFALRFFGQGMSSHVAVVAMARWFVATRGRALSIASFGFAAGQAILPLAAVAAMGFMSWKHLWIIASLSCILAIPVLSRLLAQERTPASLAETNVSVGMQGRHWKRAEALRHPLFWCMAPVILGPSAFNTAFFFHQVHLAEVKGLGHLVFVAYFPLYTAISVAVMVALGWGIDRLGSVKLMPYSLFPIILAFLVFVVAREPFGLLSGFIFLGMASGASSILPSAFWAEVYGTSNIGSIKALATALMVLGSAIGPGLTGVLIDAGVGLETQFIGIAIYFVAATILMMWGIRHATREPISRPANM